ncbi:unnamed protein product [Symbiodinium natans]|uniref:Uncharacterized protein n=1 Tax=Symbiodinium natans TaxID=878477 RepID=A0A812L5T5_9DINO|nr:unnamed protein product [Symbiodinium natans]
MDPRVPKVLWSMNLVMWIALRVYSRFLVRRLQPNQSTIDVETWRKLWWERPAATKLCVGSFPCPPYTANMEGSGHPRWDAGDLFRSRTGWPTSAEAWEERLRLHDGNLSEFGASAPRTFEELSVLLRDGLEPLLLIDREQWGPLRAALPNCDFRLVFRNEFREAQWDNRDAVQWGTPTRLRALVDARNVTMSDFADKQLDLSVSIRVHVAELGQEPEVLPMVAERIERIVFAGTEAVALMAAYEETIRTSEHPAIAQARPAISSMKLDALQLPMEALAEAVPNAFVERVPASTALEWVAQDPVRNVVVCAAKYSFLHDSAFYISEQEMEEHGDSLYNLVCHRGAERVLFHCDHSNSRGPCVAESFLEILRRQKNDKMRSYVIDHGNRAMDFPGMRNLRGQGNEAARAAGLRAVRVATKP